MSGALSAFIAILPSRFSDGRVVGMTFLNAAKKYGAKIQARPLQSRTHPDPAASFGADLGDRPADRRGCLPYSREDAKTRRREGTRRPDRLIDEIVYRLLRPY